MIPSALRLLAVALILPAVVAGGCTQDAWIGANLPALRDAAKTNSDAHSTLPKDAAPSGPDAGNCVPTPCGKRVYACGDCRDNDGDGAIDMDDPECLGPCQNAEDTFANPMPGQGHGGCTLDCYFDQDNGFGNDDCEWSHACDLVSVAPDFPPEGMACAYDPGLKLMRGASCTSPQSDKCRSVCLPLTPNGCDCFGCCNIPGAATPVFIGSVDDAGNTTCDLEHAADPVRCKPCTQVESCTNPCDACEVCVGKRVLPVTCGTQNGCVPPECPLGVASCGLDCLPACAAGLSCVTGCCILPPR